MGWYFLSLEFNLFLLTTLKLVAEVQAMSSSKKNSRPKDYTMAVANEAAKQFLVPALQALMLAFWNERRYTPIDFRISLGQKPFTYPSAVQHGKEFKVTAFADVNTVGSRKDLVQCTVNVVMQWTGPDSWVLQQVVGSAKCQFTRKPPQFPPPRPRPPQQHHGRYERQRHSNAQQSWTPPSQPLRFPEPDFHYARYSSHKQRRPPPPPRKRRSRNEGHRNQYDRGNARGNRKRT